MGMSSLQIQTKLFLPFLAPVVEEHEVETLDRITGLFVRDPDSQVVGFPGGKGLLGFYLFLLGRRMISGEVGCFIGPVRSGCMGSSRCFPCDFGFFRKELLVGKVPQGEDRADEDSGGNKEDLGLCRHVPSS